MIKNAKYPDLIITECIQVWKHSTKSHKYGQLQFVENKMNQAEPILWGNFRGWMEKRILIEPRSEAQKKCTERKSVSENKFRLWPVDVTQGYS